jgi:hypothetical protein
MAFEKDMRASAQVPLSPKGTKGLTPPDRTPRTEPRGASVAPTGVFR